MGLSYIEHLLGSRWFIAISNALDLSFAKGTRPGLLKPRPKAREVELLVLARQRDSFVRDTVKANYAYCRRR